MFKNLNSDVQVWTMLYMNTNHLKCCFQKCIPDGEKGMPDGHLT